MSLQPKYRLPAEISPLAFPHALYLAAVGAASALALASAAASAAGPWRRRSGGKGRPAAAPAGVPALPALLAVYLGLLLPSSGVVKHGYDNAGADRYTYFSGFLLVPLCFAGLMRAGGGAGGSKAAARRWGWPDPLAVALAAAAALALASARQSEVWRNNTNFYEHEFRATAGAQDPRLSCPRPPRLTHGRVYKRVRHPTAASPLSRRQVGSSERPRARPAQRWQTRRGPGGARFLFPEDWKL